MDNLANTGGVNRGLYTADLDYWNELQVYLRAGSRAGNAQVNAHLHNTNSVVSKGRRKLQKRERRREEAEQESLRL